VDDIRGAMEAALAASEESPTSEPVVSTPDPVSAETPADPSPSDVAATPPSDTGAADVPDARGNIPYVRHEAVLNKARAEYEWIKEHGDTQTVQQKLAILRRAEQDPAGFMRDFAAAARLNPHELFPAPAPPPAPVVDEKPAPDVPLENGQWVYSDAQTMKLLDWQQRQTLSQINQELAPIRQERALTQAQQRSDAMAKQVIQQARTWPGFTEHEADMRQFLVNNPRATLHDAYIHVVPQRMAEQMKTAETKGYERALADLQTKAGAASIPAPRTSAAAAAERPRSIREALEQAMQG
jgi:hypothetical protein